MRRSLLIIVALLLWGSWSWAQSSRPSTVSSSPDPGTAVAPASWAQAVTELAECLSESADGDALARSLPAAAGIRRFDRTEPQDRLSLRDATAGAIVVLARGYASGPTTVASDLSEAMREATFLPEAVRAEFILDGANIIRRANETAAQWVLSTLQPGVEQPVGVIALWQERTSPSQQPHGALIFVLIKGQQTAPGEYRINYAIYGDLGQIVR